MKEIRRRHNRTTSDTGTRVLTNKTKVREMQSFNPFGFISQTKISQNKSGNLRNYLIINNEKKMIKLAEENKLLRLQNKYLDSANNQFSLENSGMKTKLMEYQLQIQALKRQFEMQTQSQFINDNKWSNQNSTSSFLAFEDEDKSVGEEKVTKVKTPLRLNSLKSNEKLCSCQRLTQENEFLYKQASSSQKMVLKLNAQLQKSFVKLDILNRKISQRDKKIAVLSANRSSKKAILQLSSDEDNQQ